jgi:hypothetical protein
MNFSLTFMDSNRQQDLRFLTHSNFFENGKKLKNNVCKRILGLNFATIKGLG